MMVRTFRMTRLQTLFLVFIASLLSLGCPRGPEIVTYSDPLTAEEHARLGAIYEREGEYQRAFHEYTAALQHDPECLPAIIGLGNLALFQGKPQLAARYYRQALRLDQDNVAVHNNLAMAWLMAGAVERALESANRAVALGGSSDPRALDTRARARMAAGEVEGAREDWERAATLCNELCGPEARDRERRPCDQSLSDECCEIRAKLQEMYATLE